MVDLRTFFFYFLCIFLITGCKTEQPLPFIGPSKTVNGDTIQYTIEPFEFLNQNNQKINNNKLKDHIYIADFFFTSCPSICPKVRIEMLKIYDAFKDNDQVKLVSHTLDPRNDTVEKLNEYASLLEVDHNKWYFLTGDKYALQEIAGSYFVSAMEDPSAPGGIEHSGKMLLVDKTGHIRAYSEGTNPADTPGFIKKIKQLLKEYE